MDTDKRTHPRLPLENDMTYSYEDGTFQGQVLNISRSGLKFKSQQSLPLLSKVTITLFDEPSLRLQGITIWSGEKETESSAAIKFESLTQDQEYSLKMLLSSFDQADSLAGGMKPTN